MKTGSIVAICVLASPLAAEAKLGRSLLTLAETHGLGPMGRCASFAVHAGAGVTGTGNIEIAGDVGGTGAITGFGLYPLPHVEVAIDPIALVPTTFWQSNYFAATTASANCADDKLIAYAEAKAKDCTPENDACRTAAELGGQTLLAGVFESGAGAFSMAANTVLTLDGGLSDVDVNNGELSDSVFTFKMVSTLLTGANTVVHLVGGAQAKNVHWAAGAAITLGATSVMKGNLIALAAITVGANAQVEGRILAKVGAITLASGNTVKLPPRADDDDQIESAAVYYAAANSNCPDAGCIYPPLP